MFYNQSEENTKNKLAISFTNYVNNLTGTFLCIYSMTFLNIPLSVELLSKATTLQSSTHDREKGRVRMLQGITEAYPVLVKMKTS